MAGKIENATPSGRADKEIGGRNRDETLEKVPYPLRVIAYGELVARLGAAIFRPDAMNPDSRLEKVNQRRGGSQTRPCLFAVTHLQSGEIDYSPCRWLPDPCRKEPGPA